MVILYIVLAILILIVIAVGVLFYMRSQKHE